MNIRVVREAGGLGDSVRVLPVLAALGRKYRNATLWVYAPEPYRQVYDHSRLDFNFIPAPMSDDLRRPRNSPLDADARPYLKAPDGVTFDLSVDLYCPGFDYELKMGRNIEKDRIQIFLEAAGVWPCYATPRYCVTESERLSWADFKSRSKTLTADARMIGLVPFSTDPSRDWPEAQWITLANALVNCGFRVVTFDCCNGRTTRFPGQSFAGYPLPIAAAALEDCDLLISPDTGFLHLAAAIGTPALGLFAQQRGDIMCRFYPDHEWISPPPDTRGSWGCEWPCYWQRRMPCSRSTLQTIRRTCSVLAQLTPGAVLERALKMLRRHEQRGAA